MKYLESNDDSIKMEVGKGRIPFSFLGLER
jgi:hypothetical protein